MTVYDNRRGERNVRAKLTEEMVREIRRERPPVDLRRRTWRRLKAGRWTPVAELAARYGVCQTAITMVAHRKIWKHVT